MRKVIFIEIVLTAFLSVNAMALVDYACEKDAWSNIPALIDGSRNSDGKMILCPEVIQKELALQMDLNVNELYFYFAEMILPKPRKIKRITLEGILPAYEIMLLQSLGESQNWRIIDDSEMSRQIQKGQNIYTIDLADSQIQHIIVVAPGFITQKELVIPKLYSVGLWGEENLNQATVGDSRTVLTPDILKKFSLSHGFSEKEKRVGLEAQDSGSPLSSPRSAPVTSMVERQTSFIVHEKAGVGAWFGSGNDDFGISFKNWNGGFGNEFRLQVVGILEESNALSKSFFGTMGQYRSIKRLSSFAKNLIEGGSFYPYGALDFGLGFTSSGDTMSWLYGIEATAGVSFFYKNFEISLDLLGVGYSGESSEGSGSTSGFGRTNPTLSICYYWK